MSHYRQLIPCVILALAAPCVWACNTGSVRDAAFLTPRDTHRLCVIAGEGDAAIEPEYARLQAWFGEHGEDLNVRLERVDAGGPDVDWRFYGLPSAPPEIPVTVLVGASSALARPFIIAHWTPAPTDNDLARLLTTPAIGQAKKTLVDEWAVVLYAPAAGANAETWQTLKALEERWDEKQPPGISVVKLDRANPEESLFCAFAGIREDSPDWLAVMFGRGMLLAPPLMGDDIIEGNVDTLLGQLTVPCTCLQDTLGIGVSAPMRWEKKLDERFAELEEASGSGYTEITFDDQVEAMVEEVIEETVLEEEQKTLAAVLVPLGLVALAAIAGLLAILWRSRKRNGDPGD